MEANGRRSTPDQSVGIGETLTCGLMRQALRGLAYIHSKRIIHRDIKPANLLLASPPVENGRPHLVLADFGLAEIFKDKAGSKMEVKGTAAYMAPELFERPAGPRA